MALSLIFPQWQGSGKRKYLYHGAMLIREKMLAGTPQEIVKVSLEEEIELEKGIWGYRQIVRQLKNACDIIVKNRPEKIFLIGGDCGTEIAPVSYLNRRYNGDLAVLWLDAHGDLNSPATSGSHNFHGMPLRCLLGEGEESIVSRCFSTLRPSQVMMGGTRDLDPPEAEFIEKNNIDVLTVGEIENDPEMVSRQIKARGFHNVYVHIDLDVLDSGKCPWALCLTPDGIGTDALMALIRDLRSKLNVVGISIVELRPTEDMDIQPLKELVHLCNSPGLHLEK
jgi:arginase